MERKTRDGAFPAVTGVWVHIMAADGVVLSRHKMSTPPFSPAAYAVSVANPIADATAVANGVAAKAQVFVLELEKRSFVQVLRDVWRAFWCHQPPFDPIAIRRILFEGTVTGLGAGGDLVIDVELDQVPVVAGHTVRIASMTITG